MTSSSTKKDLNMKLKKEEKKIHQTFKNKHTKLGFILFTFVIFFPLRLFDVS